MRPTWELLRLLSRLLLHRHPAITTLEVIGPQNCTVTMMHGLTMRPCYSSMKCYFWCVVDLMAYSYCHNIEDHTLMCLPAAHNSLSEPGRMPWPQKPLRPCAHLNGLQGDAGQLVGAAQVQPHGRCGLPGLRMHDVRRVKTPVRVASRSE